MGPPGVRRVAPASEEVVRGARGHGLLGAERPGEVGRTKKAFTPARSVWTRR